MITYKGFTKLLNIFQGYSKVIMEIYAIEDRNLRPEIVEKFSITLDTIVNSPFEYGLFCGTLKPLNGSQPINW